MATRGPAATGSAQKQLFSKVCANLEEKASTPNARPAKTQEKNKDLQKTRMCVYYLQGKCGLGPKCKFAHSESEIRKAPNLNKTGRCANFMNGKCNKDNCTFAHGEEELVKPPSYKKAMCIWYREGKCRNGSSCGFVHDLSELRCDIESAEEIPRKPWKSASPTVDCDASTEAPSESQAETVSTDVSAAEAKPMPNEHLFRMMAGRGSAPVDQQVKSMSLAIEQLEAKLIQVQAREEAVSDRLEGETLKNQVKELEHAISKLSKQIKETEAQIRGDAPPRPAEKMMEKARKMPLTHTQRSGRSDYSQCRPVKVSGKVSAKRSYDFEIRIALGVFIVAAMVMVEMSLPK